MRKLLPIALLAALLFASGSAEELSSQAPPLRGAVGHRVENGDSWVTLGQLYGVSEERLKALNPELELSVGTRVWIPPSESGWPLHTVLRGQTLWRIGKGYGIPVEQLKQANGLPDATLMPGETLVLPRAKTPEWSLAEKVAPKPPNFVLGGKSKRPPEQLSSRSGRLAPLAPKNSGELQGWVEVRLTDKRKAWVKAESLVVGSWEPRGPEFLVQTAQEFLGVPYRWGGTDPNGYDCSGFVQEVFRLSGHSVPRTADVQYSELPKVKREELRVGDLVFFNTDGTGVSHVGISLGDHRFLHASSSRGVMESSLEQDYYRSRFVGASRLPAWVSDTP